LTARTTATVAPYRRVGTRIMAAHFLATRGREPKKPLISSSTLSMLSGVAA
jgi:hypothetical protein